VTDSLWLSLKLSAVTTVLLVPLALPLAYWLSFTRGRLRAWVEAMVALPLVLPPTVLGFYLLQGLGPESPLGAAWESLFRERLLFSFPALVMGSLIYSLPFAVQPLQASFRGLNPRLLEASWTLGASRLETFFRVVLPTCRPGLVAAIILTFAHTLGEFGVVLMVGGSIPGETRTVSIAIYDLVEALDYGEAGRLALILLGCSYAVLALLYVFDARSPRWR
jgi:molybdate transport system permease protein